MNEWNKWAIDSMTMNATQLQFHLQLIVFLSLFHPVENGYSPMCQLPAILLAIDF